MGLLTLLSAVVKRIDTRDVAVCKNSRFICIAYRIEFIVYQPNSVQTLVSEFKLPDLLNYRIAVIFLARIKQSDRYSLGIIFYRLLTGVLPFYADTAEAQKKAHLQETLPPVSGKNLPVKISTLTQEILDKMTRKDPAERFSSRLELLEALIKADEALPQELKE